jgi:hypothetical protein
LNSEALFYNNVEGPQCLVEKETQIETDHPAITAIRGQMGLTILTGLRRHPRHQEKADEDKPGAIDNDLKNDKAAPTLKGNPSPSPQTSPHLR